MRESDKTTKSDKKKKKTGEVKKKQHGNKQRLKQKT